MLESHLAGCPGCLDWQRRAHTVTRRVRARRDQAVPILAAAAMTLSSVFVVANSLRLQRYPLRAGSLGSNRPPRSFLTLGNSEQKGIPR